jgi:hypothetical protein
MHFAVATLIDAHVAVQTDHDDPVEIGGTKWVIDKIKSVGNRYRRLRFTNTYAMNSHNEFDEGSKDARWLLDESATKDERWISYLLNGDHHEYRIRSWLEGTGKSRKRKFEVFSLLSKSVVFEGFGEDVPR